MRSLKLAIALLHLSEDPPFELGLGSQNQNMSDTSSVEDLCTAMRLERLSRLFRTCRLVVVECGGCWRSYRYTCLHFVTGDWSSRFCHWKPDGRPACYFGHPPSSF